MKILFLLRHPVDTLICRRLKSELERSGHRLYFSIVERENIIQQILDHHGIEYTYLGESGKRIPGKLKSMIQIDRSLAKLVRELGPDLGFSAVYPSMGQISKMHNFPIIGMADTESAKFNILLTFPFYQVVLTPSCYRSNLLDSRIIKFNGYKELIYTHPNYFKADSSALADLGLTTDDKFVLMRFSALDATHDVGLTNIDKKRDILLNKIKELEKSATILISNTEKTLGTRFAKYDLKIHPARYLDVLAHSELYLGEGSTSASEAGTLGIPWIYTLDSFRGYLDDQERNFGLGFSIPDLTSALDKANELISDDNTKKAWRKKRERLLSEKIDVGKFLVWLIEDYPESIDKIRSDPDYQNNFR